MKCKSDICIFTATFFLLLYANYFSGMNLFMPGMIKDLYLALFAVLGLTPMFFRQRKLEKEQILVMIPWVLILCEILFNRNQDLANGYIQFFVRTIAGVMIIFMSQFGFCWRKFSMIQMVGISMPNLIATYVFFFIPGLYKVMIDFYGFVPVGTNGGIAGYRAGLQNHYSQNGTLIAFMLLTFGAILLYYITEGKRIHYAVFIMAFVSLVAIILTSKRAHFLFTVTALGVVYLIANPRQILGRGFKLFAMAIIGVLALYFLSFHISTIKTLLIRFMSAGNDGQTRTRFKMWQLALKLFKEHPLMGIGWGGYKQIYAEELFQDWQSNSAKYLNTHNTYLQLLCETGAIGLGIYLWAVLGTLIKTAQGLMYRRSLDPWKRRILYVSVTSQLFVLLYNFTGNTLYDYTLFMYSFTAMSGLSVLRKEHYIEEYEDILTMTQRIDNLGVK